MFTDTQAVPRRVAVIVRLLNEYGGDDGMEGDQLREALRPSFLDELDSAVQGDGPHAAVNATLRAAQQLGLITPEEGRYVLTGHGRYPEARQRAVDEADRLLLAALDRHVLVSASETEPYFAPFYAWYLVQSRRGTPVRTKDELAGAFRRVAEQRLTQDNPFNRTKLDGLLRWYPYAGLGWFDLDRSFVCNPRDRVARALPRVFDGKTSLLADEFVQQLGLACPELDGGEVFRKINGEAVDPDMRLTTGFAQALVELHLDGVLQITAQPDSVGWSLADADPPNDGETLRSPRMVSVKWMGAAEAQPRNARRGA